MGLQMKKKITIKELLDSLSTEEWDKLLRCGQHEFKEFSKIYTPADVKCQKASA
jgi:hypothetical protein